MHTHVFIVAFLFTLCNRLSNLKQLGLYASLDHSLLHCGWPHSCRRWLCCACVPLYCALTMITQRIMTIHTFKLMHLLLCVYIEIICDPKIIVIFIEFWDIDHNYDQRDKILTNFKDTKIPKQTCKMDGWKCLNSFINKHQTSAGFG